MDSLSPTVIGTDMNSKYADYGNMDSYLNNIPQWRQLAESFETNS